MTRERRGGRIVGPALLVLVLLIGLVLTLARLLQPTSGRLQELAIRLTAIAPVAIVVYAVAVLGALVMIRRWRVAVPLLVVGLVGLGMHLTWFAPYLTDDAPAAVAGTPLRLLTVNALAYRGASGADLVELAQDTDADVVVVEEMTGAAYREAVRAGLEAAYPHQSYTPKPDSVLTMVWSRLPLGEWTFVPGDTGSLRTTVRWAGRDVDLVGVHTGPPNRPAEWADDHAALLRSVTADPPDVMAGDFNATPDHRQLRRLLDTGLRDAGELTGGGWAPTWPSNGLVTMLGIPLPRFATIDHVLVAPGWTVESVRRVHVPRSDHTAVLAEVAPAR